MSLTSQFQQGRKDSDLVILEGFHALKHCIRFGGSIEQIVSSDISLLTKLCDHLAPDTKEIVLKSVTEVSSAEFTQLSIRPIRTRVMSIARKPDYQLNDIAPNKPIVLLDDPRDLGNVGAVIRVSAAASCGAVLTTGDTDPWHPSVLRGSAGLHFALPVIHVTSEQIAKLNRPLIGLDERGEILQNQAKLPSNSVLVFGSERAGISPELHANLAQLVRIPMRDGVSSLNLATSVAITLYSQFDISE